MSDTNKVEQLYRATFLLNKAAVSN